MVEVRDHTSGDSFIMTGGEDIYIDNPLFNNNQDFNAHRVVVTPFYVLTHYPFNFSKTTFRSSSYFFQDKLLKGLTSNFS
jgi:hypothetical protein